MKTAVEFIAISSAKRYIASIRPDLSSRLSDVIKEAKVLERKQMIAFHLWMKENDTAENAEKFFHYSDEDMLNEFLKQQP